MNLSSAVFAPLIIALLAGRSEVSAQPAPDPIDLDADGFPGVAEAPPGASDQPEVYSLSGPASMLIDRSHGQDFNVGGFAGFLTSQGWTVAELDTGPVTEAALANYDVFMVPKRLAGGIQPFSASEALAVSGFVAGGKGLWLFHDSTTNPAGINSLAAEFGVTFFEDRVIDSTNNEGPVFWPTIYELASHAIAQGVASYGYYAGCCLSVLSPAVVVGNGDEDAFSPNCPSNPATLAVYESAGRVVGSGDITPLHPAYYPELLRDEEELLLQNIANWLAGKPPTGTETTSWGRIKALYSSE